MKRAIGLALLLALVLPPSAASAEGQGRTTIRRVAVVNGASCPFPGHNGSYHAATYIVRHTTPLDVVAWQVNLKGESCVGNGGKITTFRWNKWKYVNGALPNFWEWVAWTDTVNGGGVGFNHVYRRVHAMLKLCDPTGNLVCPKKAYPFVAVTMTNSFPWSNGSVEKGL